MSWAKAQDALKMFETAVKGLETIQGLTKVGGDRASDALQAIEAIIASVLDGFAGKTTPEVILTELQAFTDRIAADDVTADKALHDKFDHEPTGERNP